MLQIHHNLKTIRTFLGLSQQSFGNLVGATKDMIFSYENGKANPSDAVLKSTAEIVGITTEKLEKHPIDVTQLDVVAIKNRAVSRAARKKEFNVTDHEMNGLPDWKDYAMRMERLAERWQQLAETEKDVLSFIQPTLNDVQQRLIVIDARIRAGQEVIVETLAGLAKTPHASLTRTIQGRMNEYLPKTFLTDSLVDPGK